MAITKLSASKQANNDGVNLGDNLAVPGPVAAAPGSVQLYDQMGNSAGTFDTIQSAIDASSDGYRIVAMAGTYTENLTINKDVTIEGANVGVSGTGARGAETIIDGQATISVEGVTIDGVSIIGDAAGPLGTTGVIVGDGSDNFSIVNSVLNGDGDFAFFVYPSVTGLNIGDNLIQGYSIGAYVSGGATEGSIHDNRFQGDGGPFTGLGNGVNSETSHVLIENNTFDGLYSGVLNLYPFGPNPVDLDSYVIDNTLINNAAERPVQVYATNASTNIVGTDYNEAFNGDISGLATGTALTFDGQGGDDHIYGFDAGDTLLGGSGSDMIFGQAGDDVLDGGTGADALAGEGGNDSFYVDQQGDTVTELTGQGTRDVVYASASFELAGGSDVEVLSTVSYAGTTAINLTGNELSQEIYGNAGANVLDGRGGTDYMFGFGGDDNYYVDSSSDVVGEAAGQGRDVVYAAANYTLGAGQEIEVLSSIDYNATTALSLSGNELANVVLGNAGANALDGGGGTDYLRGFGGNDTYYVDDAGDMAIEGAGEGTRDVVYTNASYTLTGGQQIEVLSTISQAATTAINLTGNTFANEVYGNNGVNTLNGGDGSDYLMGFAGADTFAFTTALGANNVDQILDFSIIDDVIALDDAVFTGLTPGALPAGAFVNGTTAADADDRILYNVLTGEIRYDADGNGAGASVLFASVSAGTILTASDFMVI